MPKDTAQPALPPRRFSDMLRRRVDPDEVPLALNMPRVSPHPIPNRTDRVALDLSDRKKLWLLIGAGGAGKTTLARWFGRKIVMAGDRNTPMVALDPTNRTLADFFQSVEQPDSADPTRVTAWFREFLGYLVDERHGGIVDFGGNNTSLAYTVETSPGFTDPLTEAGVAAVAAYVLTPRVDDLTMLAGFDRLGFRPPATALILNMGRAETQDDFDAVRRHPAYKAALSRGAAELWMPKLEPQSLALEIERRRLHFDQARDGVTPDGQRPADISLLERVMIRTWLDAMDQAFAPVATWLPWEGV